MQETSPIIMCVAELDPTGGGGIAADIETLGSLGCHCTPIASAISVQDTTEFKDSAVVDSPLLIEQMRAVLEDIDVSCIKLHQLACTSHVESIHTVLRDYPSRPLIIDPALWSLPMEPDFCMAMTNLLFPEADLLVLTDEEAFEFSSGTDTLPACAHQILEQGCEHVLITTASELTGAHSSHLYARSGLQQRFDWKPLPHHFVGAGSTFSAAIAAYMAHGLPLQAAVRQAQEFTFKALTHATRIGMGKLVPRRYPAGRG